MSSLAAALAQRQRDRLYRRRRIADSPPGPEVVLDGHKLLSFASNDYLGLASHPELVSAHARGARCYGAGSGAAHLLGGHSRAHHALEEELAEFTGRPRALLFSTGFMANLGCVTALAGRGDAVFGDRLNHASLVDAARASGATFKRFRHGDTTHLQRLLETWPGRLKLVLTDGVFSMDGDIAPLERLAELCRQQQAWLMVDDAHGLGVLGQHGGGSLQQAGLDHHQVPLLMGTLGKAFGVFGAFVAGEETLIEYLIQQARSYIYTTALPPAVAEAARASLKRVREDHWRREKLAERVTRFRRGATQLGLPLAPSHTPIQPLIIGRSEEALRVSEHLLSRGIWAPAIRPPTVPRGSARLRITLTAAHRPEHIDRLLAALEESRP